VVWYWRVLGTLLRSSVSSSESASANSAGEKLDNGPLWRIKVSFSPMIFVVESDMVVIACSRSTRCAMSGGWIEVKCIVERRGGTSVSGT